MKQGTSSSGSDTNLEEETFSSFFHKCPVATIVSTNDGGLIIDANGAFLCMLGYDRSDVIGRSSRELAAMWAFPEACDHYISKVYSDGALSNLPVPLRTKSGAIINTLASAESFHMNGHGYLISSFVDVTPLRQAEALSRANEERFQRLVELTSDWVWEIDEEGRYTYVSPHVQEFTGYSKNELTGKNPYEIMSEEQASQLANKINHIWKERRPFAFMEAKILHRDGHEITVESSGAPVHDTQGNFQGYHGIDRDITDRKKAEELLSQQKDELQAKSADIVKANTALRFLLRQRDEDLRDLEERISVNLREMIMPYIGRLKESTLDTTQRSWLDMAEAHLNDIASPLIRQIKNVTPRLTPKETQITILIRKGKTTNEIAALMNVSRHAVALHRHHIRNKLGLNRKKVNLRTYLFSLINLNSKR